MTQKPVPVDVICICSSDGDIKPLRLRVEDEEPNLTRIDIDEIISMKTIPYVGAEPHLYLCRS